MAARANPRRRRGHGGGGARCRDCAAPVEWAHDSDTGTRRPLDYERVEAGRRYATAPVAGGLVCWHVTDDGPGRRDHRDTCELAPPSSLNPADPRVGPDR